jgi:hypothetical protein
MLVLVTWMGFALSGWLNTGALPGLRQQPTPRRILRMMATRGQADGDDTQGFSTASLKILSRRVEEMKQSARDHEVQRLMRSAANWRTGSCTQRTLVVLDDWVRRLHTADGVSLACGTHSGDVLLVDIESGSVVETWDAVEPPGGGASANLEGEAPPDITAIVLSDDAQHVLVGDAAGVVALRTRGRKLPCMTVAHTRAVSGVFWDGPCSRVYSSSLDGRLACHDASSGRL